MPQSEPGHSPNSALSSSGNIAGASTRRGLLGLIGLAPLAVALPALAKASEPKAKSLDAVRAEVRAKLPKEPVPFKPVAEMNEREKFDFGYQRLLWSWEAAAVYDAAIFA